MARSGSEDPLSQVQYADFKTYLPGDILTKVDRASMAISLEVRVPLLDHTLVEWAARLPPLLKLRGREGKFVFKSALEPYIPLEILYRPKQGFAVPLAAWFRGPLRQRLRETLSGPALREFGFVRYGGDRCSARTAPVWVTATTVLRCGRSRCSSRFCAKSIGERFRVNCAPAASELSFDCIQMCPRNETAPIGLSDLRIKSNDTNRRRKTMRAQCCDALPPSAIFPRTLK